ncbi:HNH endonuclease [Algoriphagus lacus]|uniref:HNH endonuclease n=1 Tax=Algoriphagus lacus TaxID=2056311 RepID=A0A418PTT8_9BACT|nr:HNH endonuclease signature motif containing protein [Algoriphagus lacus]RIW17004.1 HNH endonuclease [Algoriphagus lacus]
MANRWGIPKEVEELVKARDLSCVYCGISFLEPDGSTKSKPSWEHIINDIRINGPENIALCCRSCNSSKGPKDLEIWLESSFCKKKGIDNSTLATVVLDHLKRK